MGDTKIGWTDKTWNFISGCTRVSEGCDNCYAERNILRWAPKNLSAAAREALLFKPGREIDLRPEKLNDPLGWTEPAMVFVNSMSDLFVGGVPGWMLQEAWSVMRQTPRHTYQILTKRPVPALRIMTELGLDPLPNVWIGVSVENQKWADIRTAQLRSLPASLYFLSVEPMLEGIVLDLDGISWVIVGGESGPSYRPFESDWARAIRDQCTAAEVAFFFKQYAGAAPGGNNVLDGQIWHQFPGNLAAPEQAMQGALGI